ncbi:polynucleotide adenylyltransferase [Blyttiomyces sp. JEL0837]|nr:polynucleotide adenylyltransferase [Blyttiomyces sp. JEL0837]
MSSTQQQQFPGVTPPISTAYSTAEELKVTEQLVETLKNLNHEVVLGKLDSMFKELVKRISLKKNMPESIANESGGKIFTFGSYRLGVHGRGSDIDTLCVTPKHVQREDFFNEMFALLKARPEVTDVSSVTDAYVPVLKFEFSGIPIDLICARLALPSIPDDLDLKDDNLLKNLDDRCIRSLNGSRVTDEILRLVPHVDSFRTALRCIKLWAKNRGIYSNVMGFFGGVAWAIVVARVCQLYPNAAAGVIVNKFFNIMLKWNWPQPVLLKQIEELPLAFRVWNPRTNSQDKAHRMPVITPAYPSMCSTHNVTASTNIVTLEEFKRGAEITEKIFIGTATWHDLFEKEDFFHRYKYYLQIIASTDSQERHFRWSGRVESRLRQLVMKLETVEHLRVAHPYIKNFEKVTQCRSDQEGIDAAHGIYASEPLDPEKDEVKKTVYTTTFYIGLQIAPKDVSSKEPRKLDITWPTQEFVKLVKMWDDYDQATMGIVVQYIKSSLLPPELVNDRDHPKPARKRARTQKGQGGASERSLKRSKLSEAQEPTTMESVTTPTGPSIPTADTDMDKEVTNGVDHALSMEQQAPSPVKQAVVEPEEVELSENTTSKILAEPVITPHYSGLSSGFSGPSNTSIKIKLAQPGAAKGANGSGGGGTFAN